MSVRKVVIGDATLYHGDCLEVMAEVATVHIVVTSPPYNQLVKAKATGHFKNDRWFKKVHRYGYDDQMPESKYQENLRLVVGKCLALSRGLVWINHKVRYRRGEAIIPTRILPYRVHAEIIWDRTRGMSAMRGNRFVPSHEGIWAFGKPHYWNPMHNMKYSVWRIPPVPTGESPHPCPFPIELVEPLIIASSRIGDTVFDPYMGWGTTGIAALLHKRKFIGAEKEKRWFDSACRRIEAMYKRR